MFACYGCKLVFATTYDLKQHFSLCSNFTAGSFNCGQVKCFRRFGDFKSLSRHLNCDCSCPAVDLSTQFASDVSEDLFESVQNDLVDVRSDIKESLCDLSELRTEPSLEQCPEFLGESDSSFLLQILQENALEFVGEFYSNPSFPRNLVQIVIDKTRLLI